MRNEARSISRYLRRHGDSKNKVQFYTDNAGNEFDYKIAARLSSFLNILFGCLKNGFPIAIKRLRHNAWAFYPFFFVRKVVDTKDPLPLLNHERIHVRQQRDIHLTFSLPLLVLNCVADYFGWFSPIPLLVLIVFLPTIFYGIELLRVRIKYRSSIKKTFKQWRSLTAYEMEANSRATNYDYLAERKFWAVLAYMDIKMFKDYGI